MRDQRSESSSNPFHQHRLLSTSTRLLDRLRSLSHKKTTKPVLMKHASLSLRFTRKKLPVSKACCADKATQFGALHGDMTQSARMDALDKFKNGTTGLLVATDVAARGLDIPNVGAVINYTFPLDY
jgi:ATP-dependent RNA helicase DBP3